MANTHERNESNVVIHAPAPDPTEPLVADVGIFPKKSLLLQVGFCNALLIAMMTRRIMMIPISMQTLL